MSPRIGITATPTATDGRVAESLNRAYVDAVHLAGGVPIVIPTLEPGAASTILELLDGLVLSGGGDVDPACYGQISVPEVDGVDARRDEWELALARLATERGTPLLGICRGAQVLNVACRGTLVQDLPSITDQIHRASDRCGDVVHSIDIDPASSLAEALGTVAIGANTLHHQAVADVGAGLRACAWAQDGTIEAIESTDARSILGVQWHPELLTGHAAHRRLFGWLVAAAAEAGAARAPAPVRAVA
jgi:putative glutamine amidotransferase